MAKTLVAPSQKAEAWVGGWVGGGGGAGGNLMVKKRFGRGRGRPKKKRKGRVAGVVVVVVGSTTRRGNAAVREVGGRNGAQLPLQRHGNVQVCWIAHSKHSPPRHAPRPPLPSPLRPPSLGQAGIRQSPAAWSPTTPRTRKSRQLEGPASCPCFRPGKGWGVVGVCGEVCAPVPACGW